MTDLFQRLRRIHALEHATMHLLPNTQVRGPLLGASDWLGFTLFGEVDTEAVNRAVHEALARLQGGQAELAIHPNCGTNLAVGGLLALAAGWLTLTGKRHRRARGSLAAALLMTSIVASEPLGLLAQALITTRPDLDGLRIAAITRSGQGRSMRHRISIQGS